MEEMFDLSDTNLIHSNSGDPSGIFGDSRSQETGLQRSYDQQSPEAVDNNLQPPQPRTNFHGCSRANSPDVLELLESGSVAYPDVQESNKGSTINESNLIPLTRHEPTECLAESSSSSLVDLNQVPTSTAQSNSKLDSILANATSRKKRREKPPKFSWDSGSDSSDSDIESVKPVYVSKKKVSKTKSRKKRSEKRPTSLILIGLPLHAPKTNLPRDKSPMVIESPPERVKVETSQPYLSKSNPEIISLDEFDSPKKNPILVAAVSPFRPLPNVAKVGRKQLEPDQVLPQSSTPQTERD